MNGIYLSLKSNGLNFYTLFKQPYIDGFANLCEIKNSKISYSKRFTHLIGAGLLLCPILNTIAFIALRAWKNYQDKSKQQDTEMRFVIKQEYNLLDVIEAKIRILFNKIRPGTLSIQFVINHWQKLFSRMPNPPPTWLIEIVMATQEEEKLSSDQIVWFANASEEFRALLVKKNLLAQLDSGNILDICERHPDTALDLVMDGHLKPFATHPLETLKIFQIFSTALIEKITKATMHENYASVFEFLRNSNGPKELKHLEQLYQLIESFNNEAEKNNALFAKDAEILYEIARKWYSEHIYGDDSDEMQFSMLVPLSEENFPEVSLFLKMIPANHTDYVRAQSHLGMWHLETNELKKAYHHFFNAWSKQKLDEHLKLALICKFMVAVSDKESKPIKRRYREEYEKRGYSCRELSLEEVQKMALRIQVERRKLSILPD